MALVSLQRGQAHSGVNYWNDVWLNDNEIVTQVNGNLDNSNIAAAASIAHSKLANTDAGKLLIANASGVITGTAMSGDVTISSTGVTTIGNDKVTADQLKDSAATDGDRAVTTDHIRNSAVTTAKVADDAVTAAKIADNAVENAQVADDAIKSAELDIYQNANYSTGSTAIGAGGTTLGTISSVPPGVYLVQGDLQVTTTGNAGTVTVSLLGGTAGQTSPYHATFTNGTNASGLNFVSISNDPGPDSNTKTSYGLSGVLTVVTTSNVLLYATDPSSQTERVSSALTIFGVKS